MTRPSTFFLFFLFSFIAVAQEFTLPEDLRQHNITEYNSSLFNPAFSLIRNNPESVALWTRWQWQQIDADPSTLFLNYTRKLNPESAIAAGFFQHNTGFFVNTGGVINYAYSYEFSPQVRFGAGVNLFGFVQEVADDGFFIDPQLPFPTDGTSSDFILQMAPGIFLQWNRLVVGFASENLFDYNFSTRERNTGPSERVYLTSASYDIQIGEKATNILRPTLYYKSIPRQDGQFGLGALYTTDKYWGQAGYNNFYGVSIGAGGRFFKKASVGALVEFGTDSDLDGQDATFELVLAYHIKPQFVKEPQIKKKEEAIAVVEEEEDTTAEDAIAAKKEQEEQQQKRIAEERAKALEVEKAEALRQQQLEADREEKQKEAEAAALKKREEAAARKQREQDSIKTVELENQRRKILAEQAQKRLDSLAEVKAQLAALEQQRRKDSVEQAKEAAAAKLAQEKALAETATKEKVTLEKNEKYEEVVSEGELLPGFYLITNVFGTKKYYDAFMKDLKSRGLEPKSFLRSKNNYNYVYLKRYNTMSEARRARDSKFDGRYTDKTWIFRVVGN